MDGLRLLLLSSCVLMVTAQRPSFGGCPDRSVPMQDFDLSRFMGVWYEEERVPTVFEAGASCVKNNYTKTADGKIHVENEIMTVPHIKRVVQGELKPAGKANEGKITVKYSLPEYAWLMTRERIPPGPVLQEAYGALDEFGISRNFFVKTDHKDCDVAAAVPDVIPNNPKPDSTRTVSENKAPVKEMMPPEPNNDEAPMKPMEIEKPAVPVENAEKVPIMEDVPKAPAEVNQDNKAPIEPVMKPEESKIPSEKDEPEPSKIEEMKPMKEKHVA